MSLHIERAVLYLLDQSGQRGLTRVEVAWLLWGGDITERGAEAVCRALTALREQGLIRRGGWRYYALDLDLIDEGYDSDLEEERPPVEELSAY
jgi:hypothetical protein